MNALVINDRDNVAVALQDLTAGQEILLSDRKVILCDDITRGHKFALDLSLIHI